MSGEAGVCVEPRWTVDAEQKQLPADLKGVAGRHDAQGGGGTVVEELGSPDVFDLEKLGSECADDEL
jgi:hypothetical protein